MTRSGSRWLRRNRVAVVALVFIVPAVIGVRFGIPWSDYGGGRPDLVQALRDGPTSYDGTEWEITQAAEFPGTGSDGNRIPSRSSIIGALITVTPGPDAVGDCSVELVEPPTADHPEGRSWDPLSDPRQYGYGVGEDSATLCDPDRTSPYQLEVTFLTPSDVYDRVELEVSTSEDVERALVLQLPR